VDIKVHIDG